MRRKVSTTLSYSNSIVENDQKRGSYQRAREICTIIVLDDGTFHDEIEYKKRWEKVSGRYILTDSTNQINKICIERYNGAAESRH